MIKKNPIESFSGDAHDRWSWHCHNDGDDLDDDDDAGDVDDDIGNVGDDDDADYCIEWLLQRHTRPEKMTSSVPEQPTMWEIRRRVLPEWESKHDQVC